MNDGKGKRMFEFGGSRYEVVREEGNMQCFMGCDMLGFCCEYFHFRKICANITKLQEHWVKADDVKESR